MHIADALKEKGYEVDRRRIHLPEPIKETGDFTVTVRLHREVSVEIPVTVTGEGGAQTTGAASAETSEPAEPTTDATAPATEGGDSDAAAAAD